MKRNVLVVLVLLFVTVGVAYADSLLPDDVEQFYDDCGYVCYVWPDGSGDCYPCLECEVYTPALATKEPTKVPPTDVPATPTEEPTEECKPGWGHGDKNHCHDGPPGQERITSDVQTDDN